MEYHHFQIKYCETDIFISLGSLLIQFALSWVARKEINLIPCHSISILSISKIWNTGCSKGLFYNFIRFILYQCFSGANINVGDKTKKSISFGACALIAGYETTIYFVNAANYFKWTEISRCCRKCLFLSELFIFFLFV